MLPYFKKEVIASAFPTLVEKINFIKWKFDDEFTGLRDLMRSLQCEPVNRGCKTIPFLFLYCFAAEPPPDAFLSSRYCPAVLSSEVEVQIGALK